MDVDFQSIKWDMGGARQRGCSVKCMSNTVPDGGSVNKTKIGPNTIVPTISLFYFIFQ